MWKAARVVAVLCFAMTVSWAQTSPPGNNDSLFPRPPEITDAVQFWTRVYTEVDTNSGFIHGNRHLGVVYETLEFPDNISPGNRRRETRNAIDRYRRILNDLADGNDGAMTTDVARVRALWPADTRRSTFRAAAGRLRFQLGQSDRYRAGLVRSGRWRAYIEGILAENGLPLELAALPHVESSFDPTAYSKVGAAGMWQFTRSTGLRYMRIDHIVDQRRDPYMATEAAARLLADNYAVIESWPLALTAYNHGLAGMRRAARQLGTKDIGRIVEDYDGRTFGFASRNFYAAFLAALDVERNAERFFGTVQIEPAQTHKLIELAEFVDAAPVADALGISLEELRALNPALADTVWAGEKYLPRGFPVRLPASHAATADASLAAIPRNLRFADQRPDLQHRVSRGETLSGIADRYRISLASLLRANSLRNRNFIRVGQVLNLPAATGSGTPVETAVIDGEYVVQRGDSIDRIARRLGVSQAELLSANRIDNRNRIYPGQTLRVPGAAPTAAEPTAAATAALAALPSVPPAIAEEVVPLPEPVTPDLAEAALQADIPALEEEAPLVGTLEDPEVPVDDADEANVLASAQAILAGDPSNYSVSPDGTIEVQAMETLGHFADWLGIRTQRLRDINRLPFGESVAYGQRIELDFSAVDVASFEARRQQFQENRQETFFSANRIEGIVEHVIQPGESLWVLSLRTYDVPVWLLRQYNPDMNLDRVTPGTVVKFPRLRSIDSELSGNDSNRDIG